MVNHSIAVCSPFLNVERVVSLMGVVIYVAGNVRGAGASRVGGLLVGLIGLVCAGLLGGCSAKHYRKSADTEVYQTIAEKGQAVPNIDPEFSIEQTNAVELANLVSVRDPSEFLGADADMEVGSRILPLETALAIAVRHNRSYQSRKEQLYLSALDLTLARNQWRPLFSGGGVASLIGETEQQVDTLVDPGTGETSVLLSDQMVQKERVTANGGLRSNWLIRDIGRVSAAFTTDFLRVLTGDSRSVNSSALNATVTRPLLQNAGFKQQLESLTQSERNLLYALRSFSLYRREFSIQVATAYYGVLGLKDAVRNSYANMQSSRASSERIRALAAEGRQPQSELGRLEQQELTAESSWVGAVRRYKRSLNDFRLVQLGLPVESKLVLDDRELESLEIQHPSISPEEAIKIALAGRLDYQNAVDRHADAVRRVKVAANFLKPQLDLLASAGIRSESGRSGFVLPDADRYSWSAGLEVDLPFNRKSERNNYRSALITEKQEARRLEEIGDEVKLNVLESWRELEQQKRNFEINRIGVELAQRRVEEQSLLAELGRAEAQNQVDAQNDLNSSKNQRTQALVGHTIARLEFWNNMGILHIKENGRWKEIDDTAR